MTDSKSWFEQGKQKERERIIGLLDNFISDPHRIDEVCASCTMIRTLIALIKGIH